MATPRDVPGLYVSTQILDPMAGSAAGQLSPGGESNPDSCYDSDDNHSVGRRDSALGCHSDVSRTTSDTLAAEHDDAEPDQKKPLGSRHDRTMSNPAYAAKVEFALKLGYSERQISSALDKVGSTASQNQLLGELVQASDASSSSSSSSLSSPVTGNDPGLVAMDTSLVAEGDGENKGENAGESDEDDEEERGKNLRPIVIDGSNVAMSHGAKDVFSCRGIKLAIDWFKERGHKEVTAFVPMWRKEASRPETLITDQDLLEALHRAGTVAYTPARRIPGGKRVVCYDDRFIVRLAAENNGVIVSNDNYRDLAAENPDFKKVIEERLLMYTFVNDRFMPPDDPLGRHGPSLEDFLSMRPRGGKSRPPPCPYNKKCTYGNKCKYYHPERGSQPLKAVTEKLAEQAKVKIKEVKEKGHLGQGEKKQRGMSTHDPGAGGSKRALTRTRSGVTTTAPKQSLTRTRSATANMMTTAPPPPQAKQAGSGKSQVMGKPPVKNPSVSPRSDPESEDYESYNSRLSEMRLRMEQADLRQEQHSQASVRQEQSTQDDIKRQPRSTADVKHKSAPVSKSSGHWSLMHENLRATHSDPARSYKYENDSLMASGHLALAKKLSDEGSDDGHHKLRGRGLSPNRMSPLARSSDSIIQPAKPAPVSFPNVQAAMSSGGGVKPKMQLSRQLSLKGADDPRLMQGASKFTPSMSAIPSDQDTWATAIGRDSVFSRDQPESSFPAQAPPQVFVHPPIQRMGSAPIMAAIMSTSAVTSVTSNPGLTRQTSSSDPQLNVYQHSEDGNPQIPIGWPNPQAAAATAARTSELQKEVLLRNMQSQSQVPQYHSGPNSPISPHFHLRMPTPAASQFQMPPQQQFPNMAAVAHQRAFTFSPAHQQPLPRQPAPNYFLKESQQLRMKAAEQQMIQKSSGPELRFHIHNKEPDLSSPANPRHKLYYHLCHLFKEDQVRRVMFQHPEETNPQTLCKYLL